MGALGRERACDHVGVLFGGRFSAVDVDRVVGGRNVAYFHRQRERLGAVYDHSVQYFIRDRFVYATILRGDDHLSWHEFTERGGRLHNVAEKSLEKGKERGASGGNEREKMGVFSRFRYCRNRRVLLYFKSV